MEVVKRAEEVPLWVNKLFNRKCEIECKIQTINNKVFKMYSNVGRLFCTPAPPKFTKKLAVDSFFNFGS